MRFKKNEEGIALITTLLMLGLMLALALSAIISSTTDIQVSRNVKENTRDIFVADGGLEWFKSQVSFYGNSTFTIQNPITNSSNALSVTSGTSSELFIDAYKWITSDGLQASADAGWDTPNEDACSSGTNRLAASGNFPLFYTNVDVGSRTACLKVYSPVWEGIYYPRSDGTDLYYPRDHIGNYRLNFDSSPVENANPSKPNFFAVRFPDVTSTETISIPQKSVMSDVRFIFGNNLFFFQTEPYADPQTCNLTDAVANPDGTCAAYDPNSATINTLYEPPATADGINPAINGEPIQGVCTNLDDTKALLIFQETAGVNYLYGIARRYDSDPESSSIDQVVADLTEDDTPYTFMLGNNGTNDVGTEIDGQTAETNCYTTDGSSVACDLTGLRDGSYSYAGFVKMVKIGINDPSPPASASGCVADIYVPYNESGTYIFEPLGNGHSVASQSTTGLTAPADTYSIMLVDVAESATALFTTLETINTAVDADCTWSNLSGIKGSQIFLGDGTQSVANGTGAGASDTFDYSVYANSVTDATGSILNLGGVYINHDNLEFPQ